MIKIGKSIPNISFYSCQPKTKEELEKIINERIKQEGSNCDLNDIDVSLVEDMSMMFSFSEFNGDISKWNVSKVINMSRMFYGSRFNRDISNWNIREDCYTYHVFNNCLIKEEYKPKLINDYI